MAASPPVAGRCWRAAVLTFAACDRLFDKGSKDGRPGRATRKRPPVIFAARRHSTRPRSMARPKPPRCTTSSRCSTTTNSRARSTRCTTWIATSNLPRRRARQGRQAYQKEGETKLLAQLSKGSPDHAAGGGAAEKRKPDPPRADSPRSARRKPLPGRDGECQGRAGAEGHPARCAHAHRAVGRNAEHDRAEVSTRTKRRWKDIQDANFNSLEGTVKIKPGMTLIIPYSLD